MRVPACMYIVPTNFLISFLRMQKAYLGFTQVGWQRYDIGDGADGLRLVLDTSAKQHYHY